MALNYQRAFKYSTNINYNVEKWYLSPKYDGIRCWYDMATDELYYRSGRIATLLDHIKADCRELCSENNLAMVDGELCVPGLPFSQISSLVRRTKNLQPGEKESIKLVVFAVRPVGDVNLTTPEMVEILDKLDYTSYSNLMKIEYESIQNDSEVIEQKVKQMQADGWEGAMLRNPVVSYEEGGTRTLLKVVYPRLSNLKITGFVEGNGRYKGMLGSLEVEGQGITETREVIPVRSRVSSGLSTAQRKEIWKKKDVYLGVGVTCTYQKATPIDEDEFGSLRFPRVKEIMQNCSLVRL